jgi:hypothetical protein
MDHKENVVCYEDVGASHHGEKGIDAADIAVSQKPTKLMICFGIYIGLVAWVYNFDLGMYSIISIAPDPADPSQATVELCFK